MVTRELTDAYQRRQVSGRMAQQWGKTFEQFLIRKALSQNVACVRIPDGCRTVGRKLIRIRSPFDYVLGYRGRVVVLDCKTTLAENFAHSCIDRNQLENLSLFHSQGVLAGYLVYFRKWDIISFFTADQLAYLTPRKSLAPEQGDILGYMGKFDVQRLFNSYFLHGEG